MKTINLKSLLIGALLISTIFLGVAAAVPGVGIPGIAPGGAPGLPGGAGGGAPAGGGRNQIDPTTGLPVQRGGGLPGVGPAPGGGIPGGLPIGGIGLPGVRMFPGGGMPMPTHTVKLEFKIKGEGGGSFLVLCSGGEYSIDLSHFGPDNEHSQEFNGTVLPIADLTKIGFTYSVVETHKNIIEDVEASYAVKGSALLKVGKETALGFLGNRSLVVIATVDD